MSWERYDKGIERFTLTGAALIVFCIAVILPFVVVDAAREAQESVTVKNCKELLKEGKND